MLRPLLLLLLSLTLVLLLPNPCMSTRTVESVRASLSTSMRDTLGVHLESAEAALALDDSKLAALNAELATVCQSKGWRVAQVSRAIIPSYVGDNSESGLDQAPELVLEIHTAGPATTVPSDEGEATRPHLDVGPDLLVMLEADTAVRFDALSAQDVASCTQEAIVKIKAKGVDEKALIVSLQEPLQEDSTEGLDRLARSLLEVSTQRIWKKYDKLRGGIATGNPLPAKVRSTGTLGGILMASVPDDKLAEATDSDTPLFLATSNHHVWPQNNGQPSFQPSIRWMKDVISPKCDEGTTCRRTIGNRLVGYRQKVGTDALDDSGKPKDGHDPFMDIAVTGIQRDIGVMCRILGIGAVNGVHPEGMKHKLPKGLVSTETNGISLPKWGMNVEKMGHRTHHTTGYVVEVGYKTANTFKVHSRSLPNLEGQGYNSGLQDTHYAAGTPQESSTTYKAEAQEATYLENVLKGGLKKAAGKYGKVYTAAELQAVGAGLLDKGLVTIFQEGGDSGSWVLSRKRKGMVLGVANSGAWEPFFYSSTYTADSPPPGTKHYWDAKLGLYWRGMARYGVGFTMGSVLWKVNALATAQGYPYPIKVCTETDRATLEKALLMAKKKETKQAEDQQKVLSPTQ